MRKLCPKVQTKTRRHTFLKGLISIAMLLDIYLIFNDSKVSSCLLFILEEALTQEGVDS